jgi:hypothetical protein
MTFALDSYSETGDADLEACSSGALKSELALILTPLAITLFYNTFGLNISFPLHCNKFLLFAYTLEISN